MVGTVVLGAGIYSLWIYRSNETFQKPGIPNGL